MEPGMEEPHRALVHMLLWRKSSRFRIKWQTEDKSNYKLQAITEKELNSIYLA